MRYLVVVLLILLTACVSSTGNSKLEDPAIVSSIRDGMTKDDVSEVLGEPAYIDNSANRSTWVYLHTRSRVSGSTFLPVVGPAVGNTKTKMISLTVNFIDGVVSGTETGAH